MKCLKYFLLVPSLLVASLGTHLKANPTQTEKQTQEKATATAVTHLFNDSLLLKTTIQIADCVFDTVRLTGRGQRYKGKRYFYTDKECFVVELKAKNKKATAFDWVATLIKRFLKI